MPYAPALAVWVGLISQFIPTIGTYLAGALPMLIAFTVDPWYALWVLVFVVVYQQFENYLLQPRITARTVDIHPAVAFGSVIAGTALLGAVGALIAIPATATLQAFLGAYIKRYDVTDDPRMHGRTRRRGASRPGAHAARAVPAQLTQKSNIHSHGGPARLSTGRACPGRLSVAGASVVDVKRSTQANRVEPMAGTDREKALDAALAQIERQFGKGAVMRLGDRPNEPIEVIPTGSTALDVALGVGGLPRGRVVEVYGPESSGKTTLTLHAVANAQRAGGTVAFVDAEHALDPEYAKKLGVDTDALILSQPDNGEQALEITDMLIRSGALDLIVIDSVAALVPRAEIEGEMGDSHVGLQARLMSQALRKITGALNQSKTTAIFINQLREKIGVMFGSPETTTGGRALKFYASVRLDIRRIETLKDGTEAVGNRTRVKVVKNKVAPPFKQAEFDILYGQGISREGGLIDMGVEHGFVRKSGAWYTYEGDQLGQGKENARNFLKDNPDLADEIEKKIKEKLGIGVKPAEPAAEPGPDAAGAAPAGCAGEARGGRRRPRPGRRRPRPPRRRADP